MLAKQFATALDALGPFGPAPHLAVALSGGADSMACTLLAQAWASAHGGRITSLTVDHQLRAESTAEAVQVATWMRERAITHHILTPQHHRASNNLQEAARAWRYRALTEFCRAQGILHCLIAHHAGDNRETAAHNIARGETADGASGMRHVRNFHGVRLLRPLLQIARADLEDFLRSNHAAWIEDPSNQNPRFARVRTRTMLQQNTAHADELDAMIAAHAHARTARDQALAAAAMQLVTLSPLGFAELSLPAWRALEPTLASQLLADCITTISGQTHRPRARDTARIASALQQPFRTRTLQHCELTQRGEHVRIAREAARVAPPVTLRGSGEMLWDGRFHVHYDLPKTIAYTLAALGTTGRQQLRDHASHSTYHPLPLSTPALWHLDELAFVPHIEMSHPHAPHICIGFAPPKPLAAAPFW